MVTPEPYPQPADLLCDPTSDPLKLKQWEALTGHSGACSPHQQGNHGNYQRFIILASQRTGSSFLGSLLQSHPGLICYSEVFHPLHCAFDYPFFPENDHPGILRFREEAPLLFLQKWIYRLYHPRYSAVGFKLHYPQWEDPRFAPVMNHLMHDSSLKVIHLVRENYLDILVSHHMAMRSGQWWKTDPLLISRSEQAGYGIRPAQPVNKQPFDPFPVSPEEAEAFFVSYEGSRKRFSDLFHRHSILELSYESLIRPFDESCEKVLHFLGASACELKSRILKQKQKTNAEILSNFAELQSAFAGTSWSRFFC